MEASQMSTDYFQNLPIEILLKILKSLSTIDVLNFCECYSRYEFLFEEKTLLNIINVSKKKGFNRFLKLSQITKKVRPDIVSVLNLTNVYWVTAAELRKCLKKFGNLQELHLIGTKIGISKIDIQSYKSKKLKKLAITILDKDLQESQAQYFPNIESLCVQIVSKKDFTCQYRLQGLIKKLKQLNELWVHDVTNSYPLDYDRLANTVSNIKIFAFKALCSMFNDSMFNDFTKIFICEKSGREAYFEKMEEEVPDPIKCAFNPAWKELNELHAAAPYGLSDAKKLYCGQTDINHIEFEELNFMHYSTSCSPRYVAAIRNILLSENCKKLKKVAITNCLFTDEILQTSNENPKKRRKFNHDEPLTKEHENFVDNLSNLKKLELYACCRYGGFRIYYFIQHLKNLTCLQLEIPASLNGIFIKKVFEHCVYLETLKVNVVLSNESFHHDFCRNIAMAKNLKNLRYEIYRISLEPLFSGLAQMTKMERIFLKCKYVDNFGVTYLNKFLKSNCNLELMIIIINTATDAMLKKLVKTMKLYKEKPNLFYAKKDEGIFTERFPIPELHHNGIPIPELHYCELISPHTHVADLNITDGFYTR